MSYVPRLLLAAGALAALACQKPPADNPEAALCKDQLNQARQDLNRSRDDLAKIQAALDDANDKRQAAETQLAVLQTQAKSRPAPAAPAPKQTGAGGDVGSTSSSAAPPKHAPDHPAPPEPGATRLRRK